MTAALIVPLAFAAQPASAASGFWVAKADSVAMQATAYGNVQPRAVAVLRAGATGVLQDFAARPGDAVAAAAVLGKLTGPSFDAILAARQSALTSATAALASAQQAFASAREKIAAKLATRGTVASAAAAASEAEARLATARAQLSETEDLATLRAPQAGRVLTVDAADGERIAAGQPILTLQPAGDLWLRAVFYGTDAATVRAGMAGQFVPADGGAAIAVTVRAIVGALQPDGGRTVTLDGANGTAWLDGEAGTVTVETGTLSGVAVPTRALILDRAHWWVLVHTANGNQPQSVTPGPSHGAMTLVTKGLAPGAEVVVADPYLEFHRGIGAQFQPPD